MGRELASAVARWAHLAQIGVRPELAVVCDTSPEVLALVRAADPAAAARRRLPRAARRRGASRRSTAPSHTTCTRRSTPPSSRPASICSARSRSGSTSPRTSAINRAIPPPGAARPLLVGASVLSRADRRSFRWIAERPLRPGDRGALAVPALERPRPGEADQLEADRRGQRRVRLHGRPRHARAPPAAARRLAAARTYGRSSATSSPSVPAPTARPCRATPGTTRSSSARPSTTAAVPAADRDEADRAGRDEHVDDRGRRHRGLDRVHDEAAEDAADDALRAGRRAGVARHRPRLACRRTRRSPARSSSSASRTRFCRCGPRSSTSSRTDARGCASRSTARRRRRQPRTHRLFTAALASQRERSVVDV